jgi:integrase
MSAKKHRVPTLCLHRASGRAVVRLSGTDHYCGVYGTAEAQAEYDRLTAEWLTNGRRPLVEAVAAPPADTPFVVQAEADSRLTVSELILKFWSQVEVHYRKPYGTPTTEQDNFKLSLRLLRQMFGLTPAADFGPKRLKEVRDEMVRQGWCRTLINQRVGRITRMFKWAVSEELLAAPVHQALATIAGLQRGRCGAREAKPVKPVADDHVAAVLGFVTAPVRGLIEFQRYTGCRPTEACLVWPCDIDRSAPTWLYRPHHHKTAHKGKDRVIPVGPKAQAALQPFLDGAGHFDYLFSPRQAMAALRARQRAARKTKVQPSQQARAKAAPKKRPGRRYTAWSYASAVARGVQAARRAGVPVEHWHPNQLRHAHATMVRKHFGLEAAQVTLGHSKADITQLYAERNLELAERVAREVG